MYWKVIKLKLANKQMYQTVDEWPLVGINTIINRRLYNSGSCPLSSDHLPSSDAEEGSFTPPNLR